MHAHPARTPHYSPLVSLVRGLVANAPPTRTGAACTAALPCNCAAVNGIAPGDEFRLCCRRGMPTKSCAAASRETLANDLSPISKRATQAGSGHQNEPPKLDAARCELLKNNSA